MAEPKGRISEERAVAQGRVDIGSGKWELDRHACWRPNHKSMGLRALATVRPVTDTGLVSLFEGPKISGGVA